MRPSEEDDDEQLRLHHCDRLAAAAAEEAEGDDDALWRDHIDDNPCPSDEDSQVVRTLTVDHAIPLAADDDWLHAHYDAMEDGSNEGEKAEESELEDHDSRGR